MDWREVGTAAGGRGFAALCSVRAGGGAHQDDADGWAAAYGCRRRSEPGCAGLGGDSSASLYLSKMRGRGFTL